MDSSFGLIFAVIAMLGWGFGDFLIQRSTRKIGNWGTLFFICLFGAVILTPFVYKDIPSLFSSFDSYSLLVMIGASVAVFIAVILGIYLGKEKLKIHQKIGLVLAILSAIILATTISNF